MDVAKRPTDKRIKQQKYKLMDELHAISPSQFLKLDT
jgi:hypothetical protein